MGENFPLEEDVLNLNAAMRDEVEGIVLSPESAPLPAISSEAHNLLRTCLENSSTLARLAEERRDVAASFIWRLGVAEGMTDLVLSNISEVSEHDAQLARRLPVRLALANDMMRTNSELLRDISPDNAASFWKLVDYEPRDGIHGILAVMQVMAGLKNANFIPEDVLIDLRVCRDTTILGGERRVIPAEPAEGNSAEIAESDRHDRELAEAGMRVVVGAFIAGRTGDSIDVAVFKQALLEHATRTSADPRGLNHTVRVIPMMMELLKESNDDSQAAMREYIDRVGASAEAQDLHSLPLNELVAIVRSAYRVSQSEWDTPAFQSLVKRGRKILSDFQKFATVLAQPVPAHGEGESSNMIRDEHDVSEAVQIKDLLNMMADETDEAPTVENTLALLREDGYSGQYVKRAIFLISREFQGPRRAELTRLFDDAIGEALANLDENNMLRSSAGLEAFYGEAYHMTFLAYFNSGREFIATKMRDYIGLIDGLLENDAAGLNVFPAPNEIAASLLEALHDTLWNNRYRYTDSEHIATEYAAAFERIDQLATFVSGKYVQTASFYKVRHCMRGLDTLMHWFANPTLDPQEAAARDPVHGILSEYRSVSGRQ